MTKTCPNQPEPNKLGNMIANIGSRDPIGEGGGRIFETSNGPFFEYTEGTETDGNSLELCQVLISEDIAKQFEHLLQDGGLEEMCECMDEKPETWKKKARGRLTLRAQCILDLATHFGWEEIDENPLETTETELHLRWFSEFKFEGPVTDSGVTAHEALIPELLLVLCELDPAKHAELFQQRFPIIPSAAMQNLGSSWWQTVGPAVQDKIVLLLQERCPPAYEFLWDPEAQQFGFWHRDGS